MQIYKTKTTFSVTDKHEIDLRRPQVEKFEEKKEILHGFGHDHVASGSTGLKPLRRRAPG